MREKLKQLVQNILAFLAKRILKKYNPDIIGITGSVGKTSTKEAVFTVLSQKFNVRQNIKNYNNEIGLPLTIIGAGSGERSVWLWSGVFIKALVLLAWKDKIYPNILVLEMAVDRPGDMKYLTALAPCKTGVVTNVGEVHLEFFGTVEKIAKEKSVIVTHLDRNGWAILNCDDEHICSMKDQVKGRVIKYGINNPEADLNAMEINISRSHQAGQEAEVAGLNFKMFYAGSTVPVLLPNILGEHLIYAALVAAAVGITYDMNLVDIAQSLRMFKAPKGRMNVVGGIKNTTIIDDTYNAGPASTLAAVKVLSKIETDGQKFAVLGDMLELGTYTEEGHAKIGEAVAKGNIDVLITVGQRARTIANSAREFGMAEDRVFEFSDTDRAGRFVQERLEENDFVLAKGSQGMRMEKIVKEIMADPLKAEELLVRQDGVWKKQ